VGEGGGKRDRGGGREQCMKYAIRGSQKSACVSKENGKRKREMVDKKICAKGKDNRKERKPNRISKKTVMIIKFFSLHLQGAFITHLTSQPLCLTKL